MKTPNQETEVYGDPGLALVFSERLSAPNKKLANIELPPFIPGLLDRLSHLVYEHRKKAIVALGGICVASGVAVAAHKH